MDKDHTPKYAGFQVLGGRYLAMVLECLKGGSELEDTRESD